MKKLNSSSQVVSALAALAALITVAPTASALDLRWVDGPQAGQPFAGGAIQIKAVNYDTGTLYNAIPVGTSLGFGVGGAAASVATGETALNSPASITRPILNGMPAATEDSWGILRITNIQATGAGGILRDVYNSATSSVELTAMFWGVRDFYLTQVSAGSGLPGGGQVIDGTGLRVDIYSDASKDFNQTAGPAGRTGVSAYPTVTNGTLELSLLSTPGFINANGTFGGAATEFESNTANTGYAALNVTGGASAAQFDTNAVGFGGSYGAEFMPGVVAGNASHDVFFKFTSSQGVNGWDITSNDPMVASIRQGVPDAGSSVVMLALGLVCLGVGYRRTRKV